MVTKVDRLGRRVRADKNCANRFLRNHYKTHIWTVFWNRWGWLSEVCLFWNKSIHFWWTSSRPENNKYRKEMILLKLHHTVSTTLLPSGIKYTHTWCFIPTISYRTICIANAHQFKYLFWEHGRCNMHKVKSWVCVLLRTLVEAILLNFPTVQWTADQSKILYLPISASLSLVWLGVGGGGPPGKVKSWETVAARATKSSPRDMVLRRR